MGQTKRTECNVDGARTDELGTLKSIVVVKLGRGELNW